MMLNDSKVYVFTFEDYKEAIRALRSLRSRDVELVTVIAVVRVEHHNKVKDFVSMQKEKMNDPLRQQILLLSFSI